jgi:hypothetical protein
LIPSFLLYKLAFSRLVPLVVFIYLIFLDETPLPFRNFMAITIKYDEEAIANSEVSQNAAGELIRWMGA